MADDFEGHIEGFVPFRQPRYAELNAFLKDICRNKGVQSSKVKRLLKDEFHVGHTNDLTPEEVPLFQSRMKSLLQLN